ncbi:MAG: response regulator [Pseudomonadota bacterium]
MNNDAREQLADDLGANLPFLRRYARALTGNQSSGDAYALATLEAILADPDAFGASTAPKTALFRSFHAIWTTSGAAFGDEVDIGGAAKRARDHLSKLTPNTREALLLHTVEEFSAKEVGFIMDLPESEAQDLIDIAYTEMGHHISGRVMIIEDEAIISMDLESMVSEMGHRVTGIARTKDRAIQLAGEEQADLILSDIQLADNTSGIDAVNDILAKHGDRPVIFITAFPERLLTGQGPEPAFLISKPYTEAQVKSAVSQAMFFSSTETLKA